MKPYLFAVLAALPIATMAQMGRPCVGPDGGYQPCTYVPPAQLGQPLGSGGNMVPFGQQRPTPLPNPNDYMAPPQQPQVIRIQPLPMPNPYPPRPAF